jgi:hypothetical protein
MPSQRQLVEQAVAQNGRTEAQGSRARQKVQQPTICPFVPAFSTRARRFISVGVADSISLWHRQNDSADKHLLWPRQSHASDGLALPKIYRLGCGCGTGAELDRRTGACGPPAMRGQRASDSGGHPSKVNDADLRALLASCLSMVVVGEKLGISSATVCRRARRLAT